MGDKGIFDVHVDDRLVFTKSMLGRYPDPEDVLPLVQAQLAASDARPVRANLVPPGSPFDGEAELHVGARRAEDRHADWLSPVHVLRQ
jgi:hypothetical protein